MGDLQIKGTKLSAIHGIKNGSFGGPLQIEFKLDNGAIISISQIRKREIEIKSTSPMTNDELLSIFQNVEKLLMLFDGKFYTLEKLTVSNDNAGPVDVLNEYNKTRLDYFYSKDLYQYSWLKIISFQDALTNDLYNKWISLIEDLDIAFQVFLYTLSDNKMTVDLNFAFLVELAEPFVELLKERTYYCQSLTPGERGTTLKMCIDNIIVLYGADIFAKELDNNYTLFLEKVVKSRVRIMHIKKNQRDYFNGMECIKYSLKFSLLYRSILLSLLGIPYQQYKANIQRASKNIDKWEMKEKNG